MKKAMRLREVVRVVYVTREEVDRTKLELEVAAKEYISARDAKDTAETQLTITRLALLRALESMKDEVMAGR